ncbi:MAG: polysaccharide deacetylase family protein [Parvibaculaceae bacterium]
MIWQPLIDELAEWRAAGLAPSLWLRDDDAVEPTPLLDRLVTLTAKRKIPLVLAVIPAKTDERLAAHLRSIEHVHPCVHGWAHANHAPPGEKKQELGGHREKSEVLVELTRGFARLRELHGERLLPLLVPPWNRVSPDIVAELPQLGFAAFSTFGHKPLPHPSGLAIVNCHVDLIDWKNGARCRDYGQLIAELAGELKRSRLSDQAPVGVLSHHLVSTDDVFAFLEGLFAATRGSAHWVVPQGFRA